MTAYINKIKSKAGDQQLPVTHERAVRDDNGTTLESKLQNLEGAMDKAYVAQSDNGMGRITLKKNMVSGVNTLTQSMMQATNTIYVIQYDFTLGENITVPADCVLEFGGGSLNNAAGNTYVLRLNSAKINAPKLKVFDNIKIYPEPYLELRASWFGLNSTDDCSDLLEDVLSFVALRSTLIVDIDININRPISANSRFSRIIGERVECNTNPIYNRIFSSQPIESVNETSLVTLSSEASEIENIEFFINSTYSNTYKVNLLEIKTLTDSAAEGDVILRNCCFIMQSGASEVCGLKCWGRGYFVEDCLFQIQAQGLHSAIRFIGHPNNLTDDFNVPDYSMRAHKVVGCQFHAGGGYMVWFDQGLNADTTFINTLISNNISDVTVGGVYSNAKHRGLNVIGNYLSAGATANDFFKFTNSIIGLNFVGNSVVSPTNQNRDSYISFKFNFEQTNQFAKNISIQSNFFDAKCVSSFVELTGENTLSCFTDGMIIKGNQFSDRCFTKTNEGFLIETYKNTLSNVVITDNVYIGTATVKVAVIQVTPIENGRILNNLGIESVIELRNATETNVLKDSDFINQ